MIIDFSPIQNRAMAPLTLELLAGMLWIDDVAVEVGPQALTHVYVVGIKRHRMGSKTWTG